MVCLEIDPELGSGSKSTGKQPSRLRRHPPLPSNELIDSLNWNVEMLGEGYLANPDGLQELFKQDLAGMRRDSISWATSLTP